MSAESPEPVQQTVCGMLVRQQHLCAEQGPAKAQPCPRQPYQIWGIHMTKIKMVPCGWFYPLGIAPIFMTWSNAKSHSDTEGIIHTTKEEPVRIHDEDDPVAPAEKLKTWIKNYSNDSPHQPLNDMIPVRYRKTFSNHQEPALPETSLARLPTLHPIDILHGAVLVIGYCGRFSFQVLRLNTPHPATIGRCHVPDASPTGSLRFSSSVLANSMASSSCCAATSTQ